MQMYFHNVILICLLKVNDLNTSSTTGYFTFLSATSVLHYGPIDMGFLGLMLILILEIKKILICDILADIS